MQRITIVGLGRVGASLGLAIKRWISAPEATGGRREIEVVGFDHDVEAQKAARKLGAVDSTQWNLARAVQDAALVVLAAPAGEQRAAMLELAPLLRGGSILTDTGPHKQQSLRWASDLLPIGVGFIAGHPVLPTEPDGEPHASLFEHRTYALFPHPSADEAATEVVVGLIQAVGAKPYFPDPAEHDAQVAATSMLPALAAVALMHTASHGAGWRDLQGMATSDLAEATRMAGLPPDGLAEMVALSPGDAVRWLDGFIARLGELRDLAARDDSEASERLRQFIADAHDARARWLKPGPAETLPPRESVAAHFNRLLLGGLRRRRG